MTRLKLQVTQCEMACMSIEVSGGSQAVISVHVLQSYVHCTKVSQGQPLISTAEIMQAPQVCTGSSCHGSQALAIIAHQHQAVQRQVCRYTRAILISNNLFLGQLPYVV